MLVDSRKRIDDYLSMQARDLILRIKLKLNIYYIRKRSIVMIKYLIKFDEESHQNNRKVSLIS